MNEEIRMFYWIRNQSGKVSKYLGSRNSYKFITFDSFPRPLLPNTDHRMKIATSEFSL